MKIIVFLAEGFEEVEAITVVDYLRRLDGLTVDTISIGKDLEVKGAHNILVRADKKLSDLKSVDAYDAVVIPGGMPGATNLRDNKEVIKIIRKLNEDKKLLAAICAGPIVLEEAGVLKDRKVTSYPGFEDEFKDSKYVESSVVVDKNIITSRGPALAVDFAIAIVDYLLDQEDVEILKEDILY